MIYRIEYSPGCVGHLRAISARDRAVILDAVDEQLSHQPTQETRNRKPMRPNPVAPWELRVGDFRVYYDVIESPDFLVSVRAIGVKHHNVVRIGGKVIPL